MNILSTILKAAGIIDADLALIHIIGKDPILPSPFLIGEAGAAALAAVGYAASALWRLRTGRTQQIYIKVRDAAIAQRAHEYIQQPGQEKLNSGTLFPVYTSPPMKTGFNCTVIFLTIAKVW